MEVKEIPAENLKHIEKLLDFVIESLITKDSKQMIHFLAKGVPEEVQHLVLVKELLGIKKAE